MIFDPVNPERINDIRRELEKKFNEQITPDVYQKFLKGYPVRRQAVINLTKLNGTPFMLNAELIETLEATPDTVISLVTGRKYLVQESLEEIQEKFFTMKQRFYNRQQPGAIED